MKIFRYDQNNLCRNGFTQVVRKRASAFPITSSFCCRSYYSFCYYCWPLNNYWQRQWQRQRQWQCVVNAPPHPPTPPPPTHPPPRVATWWADWGWGIYVGDELSVKLQWRKFKESSGQVESSKCKSCWCSRDDAAGTVNVKYFLLVLWCRHHA